LAADAFGAGRSAEALPEMKPWSKRELARTVALREAVQSVVPRGRRRRERAKSEKTGVKVWLPGKESGVEVEMDY
jgi:hypothetical protein